MSDEKPKMNTVIHIGVPKDRERFNQFKKDGGRIIYILSDEEAKGFTVRLHKERPEAEAAVTWKNDVYLKRWIFENDKILEGGELVCEEDQIDRMRKFSAILFEVIELHNFDSRSLKVLTKDNLPLRNIMKNFRWIEDGIKLARTKDSMKGRPAVLIGAGPSLNKQWKILADLKRKFPGLAYFCCGRSYKRLMQEGINPEFVVEAEEFEWNDAIWMFAPPPHPATVLACPPNVCPGIFTHWPAEKLVMVDHNTAQIHGWEIGTDSIDGGNSVMHLAFNLVNFMGVDRVFLAGIDLGYPDGVKEKTHADGTFHEWGGDTKKSENVYHEVMMLPSNDGTDVQSSPSYLNFKTFFEIQIQKFTEKNPKLEVYSFSPRGLKMEGVKYITFEEFARQCLNGFSSSSSDSGSSPASAESASPVSASALRFTGSLPISTGLTPKVPVAPDSVKAIKKA